jgi:hypothetical protein
MNLPNSPGLRSAPEIRLGLSATLPHDRSSSAANEPRALQVADTIRCRGKHGHQDRGADSGDQRAGRGLRHFRKPQSARADSLHCELRVSRARRAAGPLGCDTMPGRHLAAGSAQPRDHADVNGVGLGDHLAIGKAGLQRRPQKFEVRDILFDHS